VTSLYVGTPVRNGCHPFYYDSLERASKVVKLVRPPASQIYFDGIVTARSRILHDFLLSDATHLLWADADSVFGPEAIEGLVAAGKKFVGCQYPRAKVIDWTAAAAPARHEGDTPRMRAHSLVGGMWPWAELRKPELDPSSMTFEVDFLGMGLFLWSREGAQRLTDWCRANVPLRWTDSDSGGRDSCVPFQTLTLNIRTVDGREYHPFLSEDYAACWQIKACGERIYAYVGSGSPVGHMSEVLLSIT
jgi:hypothetical protein